MNRITLIIGCTASGKSSIGLELAQRIGAEIVSADSMKIYRRMDIGTAKPSSEVRRQVPHHLIDVVEPYEEFNVSRYVQMADDAIAEILGRGAPVLVVGGTALYLKSLMHGLFEGPGEDAAYRQELKQRMQSEGTEVLHQELSRVDPVAAERIHHRDYRRIERALEVYKLTGQPISLLQRQWEHPVLRYDCKCIGIGHSKEVQSQRINQRVKRMMNEGLLQEVQDLCAQPRALSNQARQAVGYAELIDHLEGKMSLEDAVERIKINTRRLAKQQRTWFKRFENVQWYTLIENQDVRSVVNDIQAQCEAT